MYNCYCGKEYKRKDFYNKHIKNCKKFQECSYEEAHKNCNEHLPEDLICLEKKSFKDNKNGIWTYKKFKDLNKEELMELDKYPIIIIEEESERSESEQPNNSDLEFLV